MQSFSLVLARESSLQVGSQSNPHRLASIFVKDAGT